MLPNHRKPRTLPSTTGFPLCQAQILETVYKIFVDIVILLPRGDAGLGRFTEHITMTATKSDATINRAKV